jgi:hypothetical protein
MKGPTGSQPHLKLLATSAIELKVPSTITPLSSFTLRRQVDADGAAQRVAEDVTRCCLGPGARPAKSRRRGRLRTGGFLRRQALASSCRSRGSRWPAPRSPARACAGCAAPSPCHVPARAVQVQQHRGVGGFGRAAGSHRPCRLAGSPVREDWKSIHTSSMPWVMVRGVAPAAVAGLEDPFALLFVERRAPGGQQGAQREDRREEGPAFHHGVEGQRSRRKSFTCSHRGAPTQHLGNPPKQRSSAL